MLVLFYSMKLPNENFKDFATNLAHSYDALFTCCLMRVVHFK